LSTRDPPKSESQWGKRYWRIDRAAVETLLEERADLRENWITFQQAEAETELQRGFRLPSSAT
jgi:hypothetical protein